MSDEKITCDSVEFELVMYNSGLTVTGKPKQYNPISAADGDVQTLLMFEILKELKELNRQLLCSRT